MLILGVGSYCGVQMNPGHCETKVLLFLPSLTTAWLANVSLNVVGHFRFILDKTTSQGVLKAIYG